jgi:hypothetical protein
MSTLHDELLALWADDMGCVEHTKWEPVRVGDDGVLTLKLHRMYESPALSAEKLMAMCDMFGTRKIEVDGYAQGGCESCDYGSQYGHEIEVRGPTKRVDDFRAWLAEYKIGGAR